jgi:carboxymethylenebutenolidase
MGFWVLPLRIEEALIYSRFGGAMAQLLREKITLSVADGTEMDAYISFYDTPRRLPGIIVLQEAFGVNSHIRNVVDRFAQHGYLAIAPELFHRTARGFEGDYNNFNSVAPHMRAMTQEGIEADLRAAFEWLKNQKTVQPENISSVGYCMGGRASFLANAVLPLHAAASYYGGGIAPALLDRAESLHAPMLFFWGEMDKHIPPEQRGAITGALKAAGKRYVNVEFSDAGHGFNCDERQSFEPRASREAWALVLEFLKA